ncbi:MAG: DNA double-strand break repair nuclease NurA [Nanoarchaeota archaeon]
MQDIEKFEESLEHSQTPHKSALNTNLNKDHSKHSTIQKILSDIKFNVNKEDKQIILKDKRIPISRELFKEIIIAPSNSKMAFIDGGNGEILRAPNFSLQFIRLYCTTYQNNKRIQRKQKEFYVLVHLKTDNTYEVRAFREYEQLEMDFNSSDSTLKQGEHKVSPSTVAEHFRKLCEIKFAEEISSELSEGDFIVRDGDLDANATYEKEFYNKILSLSKITLVGFSKTTTLTTDSGNSATVALNSISPHKKWFYAHENICFAKLHEKSKYVFRIDVSNSGKIAEIISLLAENSKDLSFLGYPYALIEADKFARVTKEELQQQKMLFLAKGGEEFRNYLSALDAHDVLNRI